MAIKRWVGGAVARKDVWTITVAGTWASGDTVTISIGTKDLIITLGATASTLVADIATQISSAIGASDNTGAGTGFTWNYGGQQFVEFKDVVASVNGAVVTVTAVNAGEPIGLVVTEVTAGDGTATESNTIVATGPEFLDNPDNYLGGVLPVDNDDLYFDTGAVSVKYALTYFRANNIDLNVYITSDWTGQLGLPAIRAVTGGSYAEYRQRYFQMRGGSKVLQVLPGLLGAVNQGFLYIDLQDQATCAVTIRTGRGTISSVPSIYLCGTTAATALTSISILAGSVAVEPDDAPTDASKYFIPGIMFIGTAASSANDCQVVFGKNAALHLGGTITIDGGTVTINSATKVGADTCLVQVNGGTLFLGIGDHHSITVELGATLYPVGASGTIANAFIRGTIDYRRGGLLGITAFRLYAGASLYCPSDQGPVFIAEFVGCTPSQLAAFVIPANRQIDWLDIATA